jgi:eukaryotic-like serine/threonine-protein kinase
MPRDRSPSTAPSFELGSLLADKYRLDRVVGEGGIGIVVAATHVHLEQKVAVKYLKPAARRQPVLCERFLREARLAAKLKSEHVVRVHDVGAAPCGTPYMVMEFLEGEDLGARLEAGPMAVAQAVDVTLQACEALGEMHAMGVVHRDLKPENLFVARTASGAAIVKLLDLGISKVLEKNPESKRQAILTGVTDRFGTPQYMPPEQLGAASNVDARADIWAIGVVLHELVTGTPPFTGESIPEICASVLLAPYAGLCGTEAPPGLEKVLRTCLAKKPEERFRNVAELARALAPFGPAGSVERAKRIAGMIVRGGESVRPMPVSGAPRVEAAPAAPPPAIGPTGALAPAPAAAPLRVQAPTLDAWGDARPAPPPVRRAGLGAKVAGGIAGVALAFALVGAVVAPYAFRRAPPPRAGRALAALAALDASEASWPVVAPPTPVEPMPAPPPPPRPRVAKPRLPARR